MMKQLLIAAGLICCAVSHSVEARALDVAYVNSPLRVHSEPAPAASRGIATRLQLDVAVFTNVGRGQYLFVEDFPLDENRRVTLQLEEASALAHNAKLVVMRHDDEGRLIEVDLPWPTNHIFRGTVVGEPTSNVFLAVNEEIANGWISIDGTRYVIGTRYTDQMTLIYDEGNVPEGMINWATYECNVRSSKEDIARANNATSRGGDQLPGDECPQVKMAMDTDFEFTDELFDGEDTVAAAYVETLVSAVAGIYQSSITDPTGAGMNLKIQYLRLWSVDDDPWRANGLDTQLDEFVLYWDTYMGGVDRHLAHLLNGRDFGGGVAKGIGGLCDDNPFARPYAISTGFDGGFPVPWAPLEDENALNWDPIVFAHETGHNFGMIHTHDPAWPFMEPTIDDDNPDLCGSNDCANASGAPIMSYCHTCEPNYTANIAMEFDEGNTGRSELLIQLLSCNFYPDDPPILADDRATTDMSTPVVVNVLANDIANDCNTLSIADFDQQSARGGRVTQDGDTLTYTPTGTIAGTDSFTYTAIDGSNQSANANVVIEIQRPTGGGGGGGVDPNDIIFVITLWGSRTADCTGDGTTNIDDLLAVLEGKALFQTETIRLR